MGIEVGKISNRVRVLVSVPVSGAPDVLNPKNLVIEPSEVEIGYVYGQTRTEDGWTEHTWTADTFRVLGRRVMENLPDGSRRYGAPRACHWPSPLMSNLPEWLGDLGAELKPYGSVDLVGDVL